MQKEIEEKIINKGTDEEIRWIHLTEPSEKTIDEILSQYPIPRDFITSSMDKDEHSRFETYKVDEQRFDLYVFLNLIKKQQGQGQIAKMDKYMALPFSIVIGDKLIITSSLRENTIANKIEKE